jgi:predicted SprT family Zn-dependent metalloprotease
MVTFGLLQGLHGFSLLGFLKSVVVAALTLAAVCLFFAYLPVLGILALIVAVVVAVVLVRQRRPQASPVEDPPAQGSPAGSAADEAQRRELLRHMEILKDCEELVNSSNNFSTVLSRYDLLLQELSYFAAFEEIGPDYLPSYGINFKTPASELWKRYFDNMAEYLNAAVDRILDAEIEKALALKTAAGQEKHMAAWVDKLQELEGVPAGTLQYINELPVAAALREPKVSVSCPCGNEFQGRPHAHKGFVLVCPKCGQKLRANTSKP